MGQNRQTWKGNKSRLNTCLGPLGKRHGGRKGGGAPAEAQPLTLNPLTSPLGWVGGSERSRPTRKRDQANCGMFLCFATWTLLVPILDGWMSPIVGQWSLSPAQIPPVFNDAEKVWSMCFRSLLSCSDFGSGKTVFSLPLVTGPHLFSCHRKTELEACIFKIRTIFF